MDAKEFAGHWNELRASVSAQWIRLTDDDLDQIGGSMDRLIGTIQQLYDYSTDEAKILVEEWLSRLEPVP